MSMEPFGLNLDTEQLSALEVYKGTLMEPVGKKKRYFIVSGLMTHASSAVISVPERYLIP